MTAAKDPSQKVIAEILAGRHDGNLGELMEAVVEHMRATSIRMYWRFNLDGDTWDQDTVTTGELVLAEELLSTEKRPMSYTELEPLKFLHHRTALLVAHLYKVRGLKKPEALARVEALTLAEQEKLMDMYEVGDAPKDQDPPASS